jgi:catechol 2,3-dioxygenase-like lactoylglutathione lyase family enzyme
LDIFLTLKIGEKVNYSFGHIQFNIDPKNQQFYSDLMNFLGWKEIHKNENMLGVGHSDGSSLWFSKGFSQDENNYDGPGMNHFAFHTKTLNDVDKAVEYLFSKGVPTLFETPRHRPEFSSDSNHTYYQVMFTSPDKILFEIVYIGEK